MRRAALPLLAVLLAGCPIPQPLPDYPPGTITPPRILVDEIAGDGNPVVFVPANCTTTPPSYKLSARVVDSNTLETIDSRWFVNYDPRSSVNRSMMAESPVPPNADTTNIIREVPPRIGGVPQYFDFLPYDHAPPPGAPAVPAEPRPGGGPNWYPQQGILRVVELVVSNGFDPLLASSPLPNRAILAGFETQVHRWVFLTVPENGTTVKCQ